MIKFFIGFSYLATFIAVFATLILCVMVLAGKNAEGGSGFFDNCFRQIRTCRMVSVIFVILLWFLISGRETQECLNLYAKLSVICSYMGYCWIAFGFLTIIINLCLSFKNQTSENTRKLAKLRNADFIQGTVFLVFSFLLDI